MHSRLRIIVTGLIAQHPKLGGVSWDYLQYPVGLARLGHDVYYIEDSGEWPYRVDGKSPDDDWILRDCTSNIEHLSSVMGRFGLQDRWAYRFPTANRWYGLSDAKRTAVLESADLVINVSGTLIRPRKYRSATRMAYIDSDPVFTQAKLAGGDRQFCARVFAHDVHFSFGESLTAGAVPETPYRWRPTRQPILLSEWPSRPAERNVLTTVMSWTSYKPVVFAGQSYGQKDVEFLKFLDLPRRVAGVGLEVAMHGTQHLDWQTEVSDAAPGPVPIEGGGRGLNAATLLQGAGWRVADSSKVGGDLDSYRNYVLSCKGEWSVAKHGYVVGRPGWFSCRSACYLAAGKPVIVEDTGFGSVLPVGEGILAFQTIDEAAAAIEEVGANYRRHARAARDIAEAYFDSNAVLTRLVDEAMSAEPHAVENWLPEPGSWSGTNPERRAPESG